MVASAINVIDEVNDRLLFQDRTYAELQHLAATGSATVKAAAVEAMDTLLGGTR
jgi:hypothetical protein